MPITPRATVRIVAPARSTNSSPRSVASLREKLIARGHEQAARFSWERTAREVMEVYSEVAKK